MKERERIVVGSIFALLFFAWLGFLLHRSPRFPGSGLGSAIGIAAAVLLLLPLAYPIVKRIPSLHVRLTERVSLQTIMAVHVYAGIVGPLLAIVHTGHKFDSWLGIALTSVMLLVVVSGFSVRYLLTYVAQDITGKLLLLQTARGDLDSAWGTMKRSGTSSGALERKSVWTASLASIGLGIPTGAEANDVVRLAESVSDLEYAVGADELLKRWFGWSLKLHIALSILLYALLATHIGSEIYFGFRWLR